MKDMSLLAKLLILIGIISAVSTAVVLFLCKFKKKQTPSENADAVKGAAEQDFEECCNACCSDSDDL